MAIQTPVSEIDSLQAKTAVINAHHGKTRTYTQAQIDALDPTTWGSSDLLRDDGVRFKSSGVVFSENKNVQTKSLAKLDGVTGEILLPTQYSLANDGDYCEFVGKLDEPNGPSSLGTIGLRNIRQNTIGFSSTIGNFVIRNDAGAHIDIDIGSAGIDAFNFHRYRVTQTSSVLWTLTVDGITVGTALRDSFLLIDNIGHAYLNEFCGQTISELIISTSTDSIKITDFKDAINNKYLVNAGLTLSTIEYTDDSIVLWSGKSLSGNNTIKVSVPNDLVTKSVIYEMENEVDVAIASDVWRIHSCITSDVLEWPLIFGSDRSLTNQGSEWEMAVRIVEDDDFFGGSTHGKEEKISVSAMLDGVSFDIDNFNILSGYSLNISQSSNCYRKVSTNYKAINVAQSDKDWKFTSEKLNLRNTIIWNSSENLTLSFMAMMPAIRSDGNGTVTNWGLWGDTPSNIDISSSGFGEVMTTTPVLAVWGGDSGIHIKMTVNSGFSELRSRSWVSDAVAYNKLYFDLYGVYTTSVGEVFASDADYFVYSKN